VFLAKAMAPALVILPARGPSFPPQRVVALSFVRNTASHVTYEYRVFIVHDGEESTFSHFSSEKLWEGAVVHVSKPGAALDGLSVAVHRVVSHPTDNGPGIAYGRGSD
jgi:hypothetical protein